MSVKPQLAFAATEKETRGLSALDRPGRAHGVFRRAMRGLLHYLSYHFVLSRSWTQTTTAAGFALTVPPTVFHPRWFISSEAFARFVDGLDLSGKIVADVGTGTGIIALAAARSGASVVIATDLNPNAAIAAAENAKTNGLSSRVKGLCCNLLDAIAPQPLFDVILTSPPKHAGRPRDLADAGWFAGAGNESFAPFFAAAKTRLKPGGRIYLMISSDSDLDQYSDLISRAGFRAKLDLVHTIYFESFLLYELTAKDGAAAGALPEPRALF
jgi:release factor glutamine methyltransferase